MPRATLPALAALILSLAACSSSRVSILGEPRYGKTGEEDYLSGEAELKEKSYPDATKFFEHVRNKYPFSKYASLSELRLADIKFAQDRFVEAADAYATFVRMHPTHDQADYAAFRIGEAHFRDAPTEFFLFPPAHEKDQVQLREAVKSLRSFLKAYAKSTYRQDAEKLLAQAEGMLAEHEWYVAQFYAKRGKWAGAAGRLEGLAREYPGFGRAPEVLLSLATAYLEMGERFRAQQTLQQLIVRHPQDERRAQAERLLAEIR